MSVDIFGRQCRDPITAPLFLNPLPAWLTYAEPRPAITWTDEATGLRCAMRPTGGSMGAWCAYLEVPNGVALEDLGAPADWVGGYEGLHGWDTGHPHLEHLTADAVRAELTREAAVAHRLAQWPRWECSGVERALADTYFESVAISLREQDGACKGGIKATRKPRGILIEWWRWTPKSCKMHKATSVAEAVAGIVAAGASEPPPRMVKLLEQWVNR